MNEEVKIPIFTVIVLSILCILSLGTGVYYWYTNYFATEPAIETVAEVAATEIELPVLYEAEHEPEHEPEYEAEEIVPDLTQPMRPVLDPRPQFVELWEYYGTTDIVGHLFIPGTEFDTYVVQFETNDLAANPSPNNWVMLDYRVDILLDWDLNIIIHGEYGSALQEIMREYFYYEFFLTNPTITFNTQYAEYDWEIFAFYVAPSTLGFAEIHYCLDTWGDEVEMFSLAALYNTRLDVTEYDQVLTLITPTGTADMFYVLQARLLRHITS